MFVFKMCSKLSNKSLSFKKNIYMSVCITFVCKCPQRPEVSTTSHGAGVTGVVGHLTWILGTRIQSSGEAARTHNC